MNSRQSTKFAAGYGTLDESSRQHARLVRDPFDEFLVPDGGTVSNNSYSGSTSAQHPYNGHLNGRSNAGGWSWWRAGLMAIAAAAAFSATVGIVSYATFTENEGSTSAAVTSGTATEQAAANMAEATEAAEVRFDKAQGQRASATNLDRPVVRETPEAPIIQQDLQQRAHEEDRPVEQLEAEPLERVEGKQETLAFVAVNAYTRRGDVVGVGYPWLEGQQLVEPYRPTTLEVVSPQEGMTYSWTIVETENVKKSLGDGFTGETVEVLFEAAPKYTVVLMETKADHTMSRVSTVEIFCKYVRREIRSLFDDERAAMFDAMQVLWKVGAEEGQAKYGNAYVDVWTIDKFHQVQDKWPTLDFYDSGVFNTCSTSIGEMFSFYAVLQVGASDIECDHLHDGIGFGITHSMVTMMFESSLQAVNPMLSLPYWDFTIESFLVDTLHDGDYTKMREVSDLWTEEWFGSVDPEDFQVKDGRWGNMTVPVVDLDEAEILSADVFGRMRSPWNVNDREYLSRGLGEMCGIPSTSFYEWPTCKTHYELQELLTSYYGYTWHSQYGPHGPVHVWIGGNLDCKKDMQIVESIIGPEYMNLIIGYSFIYRKGLFRQGLFKCEGRVEDSTSAMEVMQQAKCGCLDLDLDKVEDYTYVYDIFSNTWDFGDLTEADKKQLAIQYCNGVIGIGESSQSSSPLDPTFWSLHPTMERLLMFKQLTGTMTDLSWPDEPGLFTGDDGTVYDVVISIESDTCTGHRGSDVFPYGIVEDLMTPHFTFFGETGANTYSNRELVHFFDPTVDALNYIYDSFEWPHCAAQGFDFNELFADSSDEERGRHSENPSRAEGLDLDFGVFVQGEKREQLYGKSSLQERVQRAARK